MGYTTTIAASDVLAEAPINASQVDATSEPVSTANVTTWIGEAEGILSMLCDANGITLDDASAIKVADRGIKAFTIAQILRALMLKDEAAPYWAEWLEAKDLIGNLPQVLGDDFDGSTSIASNIDTSDPKSRTYVSWSSDRGDGWQGW